MGYQFDGENKLIILTTGTTEFSVVDMWSRWCDWHVANGQYPLAMRYVGADSISEVKRLGSTFFLVNGWRIRPQEADHRLVVNGNLYTDPAGSSPFVVPIGAYTVMTEMQVSNLSDSTLQQLPDIEYASFNGGVLIDVVNGTSGTDGKKGNQQFPVNNIADAQAIRDIRGLPKTIFVKGNLTLGLSDNMAGYSIFGEDKSSTILTLPVGTSTGISTIGTKLHALSVTGKCRGRMDITDCNMYDIEGLCATGGDANIVRCVLANNIQMNSTADQSFIFTDCHGPAGVDTPEIDANGCPANINFSNFNGAIKFRNITNVLSNVSIGINAGHITLESTVSDAELVYLQGSAKLVNNSTLPAGKLDASGLLKPVDDQYFRRIYLSSTGATGQEYPRGLKDSPVSNVTDALALAQKYNCNELHFHSDMTVPNGADISHFVVSAHSTFKHLITEAGCVTENTMFRDIKLTGPMGGWSSFMEVLLVDVTELWGNVDHALLEGTVSFRDNTSTHVHMRDVRSHTQTPVELVINQAEANIVNASGVFTLKNKTGTNHFSMHSEYSEITIDATCTGGVIYLTGNGTLVDNSAGATVVNLMASGGALTAGQDSKLTELHGAMARQLGLMMENHVEDDIVRNAAGQKTSSKFYLYDSKANALVHDKATGLLPDTYSTSIAYDSGGKVTLFKVVRN